MLELLLVVGALVAGVLLASKLKALAAKAWAWLKAGLQKLPLVGSLIK